MTHHPRLCAGVAVLCAAVICSGCGSARARRSGASATPSESAVLRQVPVVVDGNIDEWPQDAAGLADGRYLYVRFAVQGEQFTLESANKSLTLYLDTDGNAATGLPANSAPVPEAAGSDLQVQFSPRGEDGSFRQGVALHSIDRAGRATALKPAPSDFTFAPTYASEWYEARISRRLPGAGRGNAPVRGVVVLFDESGNVDGYADPFEIALPPLAPDTALAAEIPAPAPGGLRVMSYNVFKGQMVDKPESFARLFRAVAPDVVMLQEWDRGGANEIKAWFVTLVPSGSGWHVVQAAGGDVAIVSRYPLAALGADNLQVPASGGQNQAVRFVAATATTPLGEVAVGNAHLKCCGGMGGPEDARRLAEAQAINAALKQSLSGKTVPRIVGGDLNMVATSTPLNALANGLDTDGGNLGSVEAPVLGDPGVFSTWSDSNTEFAPGRLDFLLISGSAAQAVQAFVVDTSRLSEAALSRHGLRRDDTAHSDHLPVVVDLAVRTP